MSSIAARIFQRALQEKLAFVPLGSAGAKLGQQAPGPGGAPMGGMDPAAAGGSPMDPSMGMPPGAPPMDPAAMGGMPPGAPPMDPSMGGMPPAPPMDPAMAGMPPMDPAMMAPPADLGAAASGDAGGVTKEDAETVDQITKRTMDIVRQTLEMVGKAKPVEGKPEDAAATPGPITGQAGFDPSKLPGPLKMASVLTKGFKLAATQPPKVQPAAPGKVVAATPVQPKPAVKITKPGGDISG